ARSRGPVPGLAGAVVVGQDAAAVLGDPVAGGGVEPVAVGVDGLAATVGVEVVPAGYVVGDGLGVEVGLGRAIGPPAGQVAGGRGVEHGRVAVVDAGQARAGGGGGVAAGAPADGVLGPPVGGVVAGVLARLAQRVQHGRPRGLRGVATGGPAGACWSGGRRGAAGRGAATELGSVRGWAGSAGADGGADEPQQLLAAGAGVRGGVEGVGGLVADPVAQ